MIIDRIGNLDRYSGLIENLELLRSFLDSEGAKNLQPGDYPLKGEEIFARVLNFNTSPEGPLQGKLEAHRKYIDIHCVIHGAERVQYAPIGEMTCVKEYDPQIDVAWYAHEGKPSQLYLREGQFALFLPQEGHEPGCMIDHPEPVRKFVFKVHHEALKK